MLEGFDGDTPRLRAPASRATVKQLVTHTTGLGYWFFSEELERWEAVTSTPNVLSGANVIFTAPLLADPGTTYVYGINTDWLGKVVEAAGGVGLDVAIKDGITGPLGMDETAFRIAEEWKDGDSPRCNQGRRRVGRTAALELNQSPEYYAGGHGLYSTPQRLHQVRAGAAARRRAGRRPDPAVRTRWTPRSPTRSATSTSRPTSRRPTRRPPTSSTPGRAGSGATGCCSTPRTCPGMRRAGSGAWAGLCNTHFWVDRTTGICASIYSNFLPFVTPEAFALYNNYEQALYAAARRVRPAGWIKALTRCRSRKTASVTAREETR